MLSARVLSRSSLAAAPAAPGMPAPRSSHHRTRVILRGNNDDLIKELDAIHSRAVEVVRNLGDRRKKIEDLRTATITSLRGSVRELLQQELDSLKSIAMDLKGGNNNAPSGGGKPEENDPAAAAAEAGLVEWPVDPEEPRSPEVRAVFVDRIDRPSRTK